MTNQVMNFNSTNYPNYQQNQAAYNAQQTNTNQPMYINGIDVNAARKRIMIITDNWRTREPMDGKWRAGFWDCCWRQMGCLAIFSSCLIAQQIARPVCNENICIYFLLAFK